MNAPAAGATSSLSERVLEWFFAPVPRGRVAVLRSAVYSLVCLDVLWIRPWVLDHGSIPTELYQPLFLGRLLPLPAPTPGLTRAIQVALLACAALAAAGKLPRAAGAGTLLLYLEWMVVAFSYGKVDHDRFAFLVALAVLPTAGPAKWGEQTEDAASGWAVRSIQVAVVLTYFLGAFAKLRFGGLGWVNGATLTRAVLRRGTTPALPVLQYPWVLKAGQYAIVVFELASPLMLLTPRRAGYALLWAALLFRAVTYSSLQISFYPHTLCLLAFLPLERLPSITKRRTSKRGTAAVTGA